PRNHKIHPLNQKIRRIENSYYARCDSLCFTSRRMIGGGRGGSSRERMRQPVPAVARTAAHEHTSCASPHLRRSEVTASRTHQGMHDLRDFRPDLRGAIGSLHRAGFDGEAYVLAVALEGAYESALDMAQAIGGAVLRVQRALEGELPDDARAALQSAHTEVVRVVAALTRLNTTAPQHPTSALPAATVACSSS